MLSCIHHAWWCLNYSLHHTYMTSILIWPETVSCWLSPNLFDIRLQLYIPLECVPMPLIHHCTEIVFECVQLKFEPHLDCQALQNSNGIQRTHLNPSVSITIALRKTHWSGGLAIIAITMPVTAHEGVTFCIIMSHPLMTFPPPYKDVLEKLY
jgi:hypothetical protein